MERFEAVRRAPGSPILRALAWVAGAVAWLGAAVVGSVLAVVFAATVVVVGLMASALLALSLAALRARRALRPEPDSDILEARQVGGHSWVAYGWEGRR